MKAALTARTSLLIGAVISIIAYWVSYPIVKPDPDFALCYPIVALLLGGVAGAIGDRLRPAQRGAIVAPAVVVVGGIVAGVSAGPVGWLIVVLLLLLFGLQAF